jgi:hypothetical protein
MFNIFVSLSINSSFDFSITVEYVKTHHLFLFNFKNIHYQFYQYNNHQPYRDLLRLLCYTKLFKQLHHFSFIF